MGVNDAEWGFNYVKDYIYNIGKKILVKVRRKRG